MLTLTITHKSTPYQIKIPPTSTISTLKSTLQTQTNIPPSQQQLSTMTKQGKKQIFSDDLMPLQVANITNQMQLQVKNLGKQIQWDYVFFVEYGGPLVIFPLLFLMGDRERYGHVQIIALVMAVLHYLKREYETACVHVFSRYTMPFKRIFINSIHYWVFFALMNGIEIFFFPSSHTYSPLVLGLLFISWFTFQFLNYQCHLVLASFRKKKSKTEGYENPSKNRGIPYGWGFNMVSCANYFWEVMGWLVFALVTRAYTSWFFFVVSLLQMVDWALKKHKAYKKEFGDKYPRNRKAMIPFII